ncbi:MAG: DUF2130 domain-containing protein [Cytophagaceae bacterium]
MAVINEITCPKCGHHFNAETELAKEIETKVRANLNSKFVEEIGKKTKELEEKERLRIQQFEKDRKQLEEQAKLKAKEEADANTKNLLLELEQKNKENLSLKQKEFELIKAQQQLASIEQEITLKKEKEFIERQKQLEENIRLQSEEQSQMKLKEKDTQLEQMKKQVAEMTRKLEQGSMQLQGEAQELILEELLKDSFPFDTIEEVGKGVKGADVVQTVKNKWGVDCGTIIYESKRTKAFSDSWIDKLKSDLRGQKADVAVLVTEVMPKEMTGFGLKDGIWVCTFKEVKGLATVLREALLRISEAKESEENRGEKMHMLYSYLTSNEFRQQVEAIVEGFTSMKSALDKEKKAMMKLWAEREKQIDKVVQSTVSMYGSIRGIAGSAVGEIKSLELDTDEDLLLE